MAPIKAELAGRQGGEAEAGISAAQALGKCLGVLGHPLLLARAIALGSEAFPNLKELGKGYTPQIDAATPELLTLDDSGREKILKSAFRLASADAEIQAEEDLPLRAIADAPCPSTRGCLGWKSPTSSGNLPPRIRTR